MWARRCGWALAGCVLLGSYPARAEAAPPEAASGTTYALAWVRDEGAESCAAAGALVRDVNARLGYSPFDPNAARVIEIRIERIASGFRSRLFVRGPDGAALGRRLITSDDSACDALLSATALAVALLIDPESASRTPPSAPPPATSTPAPPRTPPAPRAPAQPRREVPLQTNPRRQSGSVALHGLVTTGLVPSAAAGLELHVAAQPHPRFGWSLNAFYVASADAHSDALTLHVNLVGLGAAATLQLLEGGGSSLSLAAGPTLGVLRSAVSTRDTGGTTPRATGAGEWPSLFVEASLNGQVAIMPELFVSARAAVLTPLMTRELGLSTDGGPTETLFRQPTLAATGGVGLGWSFF